MYKKIVHFLSSGYVTIVTIFLAILSSLSTVAYDEEFYKELPWQPEKIWLFCFAIIVPPLCVGFEIMKNYFSRKDIIDYFDKLGYDNDVS